MNAVLLPRSYVCFARALVLTLHKVTAQTCFTSRQLNSTCTTTTVVSLTTRRRNMSSLPSTMKAVVVSKTGGPEVLEYTTSQPVPKLSDGQVLVKNKFAGINYIDTYCKSTLVLCSRGW